MWYHIQNAKYRVWMEMYTLQDDPIGQRTIQELTAAARRGCNVVLIYDHFGSWNLRVATVAHQQDSALQELRDAKADVRVFNKIHLAPLTSSRLFFRNHRKLLIIGTPALSCATFLSLSPA